MFKSLISFGQVTSTVLGIRHLPLETKNIKILFQKRKRYGKRDWTVHSPSAVFASINPFIPLNDEDRISRPSRTKSYIVLEQGGLLEATVSFSIADRKSLGIKNKSRQLSLLYKVQSMNLRDTLNGLISREFKTPFFAADDLGLGSLNQTFAVTVDGYDFEVGVTQEQLGNNFSSTITNGSNYFKVVLYRIMEEYINLRRQNNQTYNTPVVIDNNNYLNSNGLFIVGDGLPLFVNQQDEVASSFTEPLVEEANPMGREEPRLNVVPEVSSLARLRPVEHLLAF